MVSQTPSAPGATDALSPVERGGIPLLRTWEREPSIFGGVLIESSLKDFWIETIAHMPLTGLGAN